MNRRRFLAALAALPFVGKALVDVQPEPELEVYWSQGVEDDIAAYDEWNVRLDDTRATRWSFANGSSVEFT